MKQIYGLLLFVLMSSIADAQVKKGEIVLGGHLGYSDQSQAQLTSPPVTTKSTLLDINPSIGKAIRDNLVLGIDIAYMHGTDGQTPAGTGASSQTENGFTAGVFIRRYKPIGAGFSLFGQAEVSGNYSHSNYVAPSSNLVLNRYNSYGFALGITPGIAYALSRRWQIETSLPNFLSVTYDHNKTTQQYDNSPASSVDGHSFGISSSLTGNDEFTVGVRYFIGG
jgi:hypothetical protein